HRIARRDRHNAKPKRFRLLGLGDAHTTETADRFTKSAIGFRRVMLGGKNEPVHVAAEADRIEAPSVCSAGTRTTSSRNASPPPRLMPSTACAVLSSVKPSGAAKVKPSLGCRKRRPRTKPSPGSSP